MAETEDIRDQWDDEDAEPNEEPPLTADELDELKSVLLHRKKELLAAVNRHVHDATAEQETGGDEMDEANRLSEQAYQLRLADKEQKLLAQIDRALRKFDAGTYGTCEGTGEFIGRKRLRARPWARYSVEYKTRLERQKGERDRHRTL